ncbi:hypothetical protein [Nocardiopsis chromatogenes]|uniref:hypothetical protein n=1 Tax=Nocardiopsis chromatogenes TaxID=280239 RepID=UPI00034A1623|nr:hypothetical protein [Nocardiopsis chromatogenes]
MISIPDRAQWDRARAAHRAASADLWSYPGVTGVAVGVERTGGEPTGRAAVVVYVARKLTAQDLAPGDLLPDVVGDVPVDVVEAVFEAQSDEHRERRAPMPGGVSIGHLDPPITGTLGSRVFDDTAGADMILSNWHVLCGSGDCGGDIVVQPGPADDGDADDAVARVHRALITDRVDAALARPTGARDLVPEFFNLGVFGGFATAEFGAPVRKSGRTTGVTAGTVTGAGDFLVNYHPFVLLFRDQIVIEGDGAPFSAGGDSGSLVVDSADRLVGLLFAGSPAHTLANPIDEVLTAFGITADAELLADQLL